MATIRITIRDCIDETFVHVIDISDEHAEIPSNFTIDDDFYLEEGDIYDKTWKYLTETLIPREVNYLPPDWYIASLKHLEGGEQQ